MEGYIYRLMQLGFKLGDAFKKYDEYMSMCDAEGLEEYISDLEDDLYVD